MHWTCAGGYALTAHGRHKPHHPESDCVVASCWGLSCGESGSHISYSVSRGSRALFSPVPEKYVPAGQSSYASGAWWEAAAASSTPGKLRWLRRPVTMCKHLQVACSIQTRIDQ